MTKKQATTISILIIITIALGFLVSRRFWFRLDLTKNKAYTISSVSRNLYTEIPDQVRVTYYVSDKLKAIHPMPGEIEDLLREYAAYSHGKIQVTVRDPVKTQVVESVEAMGITAQQIQTLEQDEAGIITVYTGIVIDYLDQIEVLPVVFSLSTLEYDLTSRIRSMVRGSVRQAGIIAPDNPMNFNEEYGYLYNTLVSSAYRLRLINPGQDIPDDLPLLFVLGGVETLDDAALYQIDRYIQMGGSVFFTVKAVAIDTEAGLEARLLEDRGLLAMLSSYGISIKPEIAMDRSALTMQYQTRAQNGAIQLRIVRNPQWIRVLPENGNPNHPVSAVFTGLDLYWPSPMEFSDPESVDIIPLFTSTIDAWSMEAPFSTNPDISYLMERDADETWGVKIFGASLSGLFPSWFRNRPVPESGESEGLPDMPETPKPARLIVVSDSDFATSFINVTRAQHNLDFLLLAADWLSNDEDIIGIRNRESGTGKLDSIIDPVNKAAAKRFTQVFNIIVMPLLIILAAVVIAVRRSAKSRFRAGQDGTVNETVKEQSDEV